MKHFYIILLLIALLFVPFFHSESYVFTESEMQQYHPDVVENQIDHEYSYSIPSYLFRMNWGWNGYYNDGLYSIQPNGWNAGGYQFSLSTYMLSNFYN